MRVKSYFIISVVLVLSIVTTSATYAQITTYNKEQYNRVKVLLKDDTDLLKMQQHYITVDHGIYKENTFFISDFSDTELQILDSLGITYELQISDVTQFYATRYRQQTKAYNVHGCVDCKEYLKPSNFNLGTLAGFYTYQEYLDVLDSMHAKYPNLITQKTALTKNTEEGRPIYYVKISDNPNIDEPNEPEVLYTAVHHAREVQSLSQLIFYMWYLLENYNTDPQIKYLVDNRALYFIPCVNPDGYIFNEVSEPNGGGMWRKNRKNNGDGTIGVDLNRNYDSYWGYDNQGSSPSGWSDTYRGISAFSEKETQAIKAFCENRNFVLALNAHTFSNLLIYPFSHIPNNETEDSLMYRTMAHDMVSCSGFHYGTPNQTVGYVTNGDSDGWMYTPNALKNKILAFTPEAGSINDGFWPAPNRIVPIAKNTMYQNLSLAWMAGAYADLKVERLNELSQSQPRVYFSLKRLGLEDGDFTIDIMPISQNILSVATSSIVVSNLDLGAQIDSFIALEFNNNTVNGEEVKFVIQYRHSNGYVYSDTITQRFGKFEDIFSNDGSNFMGFETINNDWQLTNVDNKTVITDSENGSYGLNETKFLTTEEIDLTKYKHVVLQFNVKWDIERGFDFFVVEAKSRTQNNWQVLCGSNAALGTDFQENFKVYDGQKDWIKEQILLNDFAGEKIQIRIRFQTDAGVVKDGIYIDDFKVMGMQEDVNSIDESLKRAEVYSEIKLFPNPAQHTLNIICNNNSDGYIEIMDAMGRVVENITIDSSKSKYNVNVSLLPSGLYYVQYVSSTQRKSIPEKLLIVK